MRVEQVSIMKEEAASKTMTAPVFMSSSTSYIRQKLPAMPGVLPDITMI